MGTVKHRDKIMNFFQRTPVVTVSSLKKIVGEKSSYVYLMLTKLVKQGKINRITRGMYSLHTDPTIAVFCFKPAYLGLQEALSIHGLWEQETNPVILTTKTVRRGIRQVFGSNVILKRIPSSLFFGVEYIPYGDFYVPVSDIEKTFLDLIYFKQPLDATLIRRFRKRINVVKFKKYLKYYTPEIRRDANQLLRL